MKRQPSSTTGTEGRVGSGLTPARAKAVAGALESWFSEHGADYPWRRTRDPYAVLVSEVMLQQTQIASVLEGGYYARWMQRFPDLPSLALAGEQEVLSCWQGLGYYRRARNLKRLAELLLREYAGSFPQTHGELLQLPGVGPYTAGALASFCHDQPAPIVDGNVARVLSRLQNSAMAVDGTTGVKRLWGWARDLVTAARSPRLLNSALMELGQRVCRPRQVDCDRCPVQRFCLAREPLSLPVKQAVKTVTEQTEMACWLMQRGRLLMEQEQGSRRTGLWRLPILAPEEWAQAPAPLWSGSYAITRYRVKLSVHPGDGHWARAQIAEGRRRLSWLPLLELADLPVMSPHRRAIKALLNQA